MQRVKNFEKLFEYFCQHPTFVGTYAGHLYADFKLGNLDNLKQNQIMIEYKVPQKMLNFNQVVHGGAFATLLDATTTIAILSVDNQVRKSVTVDMGQSNLKPAKEGDVIQMLCEVDRMGKNMAYSSCKMFVNDKAVLTGYHTKFIFQKTWDEKMKEIIEQN